MTEIINKNLEKKGIAEDYFFVIP